MRVSAIDIGTNTILLLIADIDRDGTIRVVRDEQVIARLGKGVDADRNIMPETFERAFVFLRDYMSIIGEARVDRVIACGSSFLRDASNRQEFVDFLKSRLGLDVRVLSGEEEASLTYFGTVSGFRKLRVKEGFAVLDIGGGSTELTVGTESEISRRTSLDIGSVRLTERFLKRSPPTHTDLAFASDYIRQQLQQVPPLPRASQLIGVAGTLTTLAALDLGIATYDRSKVTGHILKRSTVESLFNELETKDFEAIKSYPQILPGRADIILAGILILRETLRMFDRDGVTVSDRGVRYGIALEAAQRETRF